MLKVTLYSKDLVLFIIGMEDLFEIKAKLKPVISRWNHVGLALRLDYTALEENKDLEDCQTILWLNKTYNTEQFGEPSWKLLAEAVGDQSGGNKPSSS